MNGGGPWVCSNAYCQGQFYRYTYPCVGDVPWIYVGYERSRWELLRARAQALLPQAGTFALDEIYRAEGSQLWQSHLQELEANGLLSRENNTVLEPIGERRGVTLWETVDYMRPRIGGYLGIEGLPRQYGVARMDGNLVIDTEWVQKVLDLYERVHS